MKNIFTTLLLCAIALSAKAQQMYENKNINYSFNVIEAEAAKGNVSAIKALGDCYNYGRQSNATYPGVVDYNKALECYKKSSDYGYPWGAWEIARMYEAGKLKDADAKKAAEMWHEKAFKEFKIYADRGDANAMDNLSEYYAGYNGDKYRDGLKNLYWSLCSLEAGNPSAATNVAFCYTYENGVEKDTVFALAWHARFCIEAAEKGWPVEKYLDYKKLAEAGYSKADWKCLAEPTYLPIPRILTQNEDSINDVVIFAVDLLKTRAEDFRIACRTHKHITETPADNESFTSSTIPSATYQETKTSTQKRKRNWLSAIGRALDVVSSVAGGQNVMSALSQSLSGNTANAAMAQSFQYSGDQRKGQQDFNGRIIRNELTAPCVYGQAHYTWYEDGYCFVYSVTTCVGCYGKKTCYLCNGQGKIYNSYFKNYQQCTICQGSGRCKYCQGAGNQTMSKLWAPGEAEAYQAAKREVAADGYSSSSSFSSSSSSSRTCPKCGGKGYRPESYTYAAGSSMAPYHNAGGTNCSICNKATDHYHYRCTECKRH